ncbi:MAG TPA: hypothetical protein VK689_11805 [Armatimonadota bacterium]|nr:hypothetical protein [Armatimonadota bacterium]
MKRTVGAALCAALSTLSVLLVPATRGLAAPQTSPNAPRIPNLIAPSFFEGFEPIPPDRNGTSPSLQFLVFEDERGLHVVRLADQVEVFSEELDREFQVGFDPSDQRLFLVETQRDGYRFRFINPDTGAVLLDERSTERPDIRINFDATVNVLALRDRTRTRLEVFDAGGRVRFRRNASAQVQIGINLFSPTVVLIDPTSFGGALVEAVNAATGRLTVRERTTRAQLRVGFEPFGPALVIAQRTGAQTFRVRLIDSETGGIRLSRSFSGALNVGFTPEGSLLGIRTRDSFQARLFLFRTLDGRQVFTQ